METTLNELMAEPAMASLVFTLVWGILGISFGWVILRAMDGMLGLKWRRKPKEDEDEKQLPTVLEALLHRPSTGLGIYLGLRFVGVVVYFTVLLYAMGVIR